MIEIILTVCAIANPANCEEKISSVRLGRLAPAMHDGRATLYRAVDRPTSRMDGATKWSCDYPGSKKRQDLTCSRGRVSKPDASAVALREARQRGAVGPSVRAEGNAPGQFADLDRFDDPQARHVDDRDVVRDAIGDQQIFLVRRKGAVPNPLADQEIFQDGVSDAIDHRHPIGRSEIDEAELAVPGDIDADRLDRLGPEAREFRT